MRSSILQAFLVLVFAVPSVLAERVPGRYIVEFTTESVAHHTRNIRSAEAASYRSRIRGEQAQAKTILSQHGATVLDGVETVANALFVQVPDAAATQLASLPGVKRVVPVHLYYPVLDQAVLLHNVPGAWDLVGGTSQAGAGMKI